MSFFKAILKKTSSINYLSFLFIISHSILLLMITYTFPIINNQINTKAFDLQSFGYSFSQAKTIVNNLNEYTTNLYVYPQLTFLDVLYPILLALFLSSFLYRLKTITSSKIHFFLLIFPFIAMFCDYLENGCILLMVTKTIELTKSFVYISSSFTILKSSFTTITWISIMYYSYKWLRNKFFKK